MYLTTRDDPGSNVGLEASQSMVVLSSNAWSVVKPVLARWVGRLPGLLAASMLSAVLAEEPFLEERTEPLTLGALRALVRENSEAVQMAMLQAEVERRLEAAEAGLYEPQVVGSVERVDNQRPNNAQQQANLGFYATPVFTERNTLYSGGLEFLSPLGTKLQTGLTFRELVNSVQQGRGPEYETFLGASLVQPLLRNFGTLPTLAKLRLAAMASEIAFQQYRRQLMLTVAEAEAAYWDLYLAQQRDRIARDSLGLGEKLLQDNQARFEIGNSSQLEVLQAEAGVALRKARFNDARQRVSETAVRLRNALGGVWGNQAALPQAADAPELLEDSRSPLDNYTTARTLNPDYQVRELELAREGIRVKYAANQRLPELNLRAGYGLNGLGLSPGESFADIDDASYAAWSVGVELRIPLAGGVRQRHEYYAAKAAEERALMGVRAALTQLFNGVDSSRRRIRLHRDNVDNYESVASFHENLLQSQLDRLAEGVVDSRTVLETEEQLSDARVAVVESLILYRRAYLELELVRGSFLQDRGMDLTQDDLRRETQGVLDSARLSPQAVDLLQRRALTELESTSSPTVP